MKVVIQRSKEASVKVNNKLINKIDFGYVILVGFSTYDTEEDLKYLVKKIVNLRVFDDENGIMNKSIIDVNGNILSISQFTLQASTKKGNRPSYDQALNGDEALKLYNSFNKMLNEYVTTYEGAFGCDMQVSLLNDGPVTIIIDSKNK